MGTNVELRLSRTVRELRRPVLTVRRAHRGPDDPDALALKEPDHCPAPLGVTIADHHWARAQDRFIGIGEVPHGFVRFPVIVMTNASSG